VLDAMRGLAAFAVLWFHFCRYNPVVPKDSFLYASGTHGWIGVEVFFVISGFVIPLALAASSFSLRDLPTFLLKRLVRLQPPYMASIVIVLAIIYLTNGVSDGGAKPTLLQIALHPFYLNGLFKIPWLTPVYWTLAVEVQYYFVVALAFPVIRRPMLFWSLLAPVCIVLSFLLPYRGYVFFYLPFFLLGIAAYHFTSGGIKALPFIAFSVVLAYIGMKTVHPYAGLASLAATLAIAYVRKAPRVLVALGAISYPLYLLHWPVGFPAAKLVGDLFQTSSPAVHIPAAIIASIAAAWVLHRAVEVPAQRWSSAIRYSGRARAPLQDAGSGLTPSVDAGSGVVGS
jgi:peptidoglycan/LPS O-acetylase OafA/YrhL